MQEMHLEIYEDGSLTTEAVNYIQAEIPNSVIKFKADRDNVINQVLNKYPCSKLFRQSNIFGYKLFDVMLYETKPFFYIDSDIVFYRRFFFPKFGDNPVFMMDAESSYCFPNSKIYLLSKSLLPKINAGFYYFPPSLFCIEIIEDLLSKNYNGKIYAHHWSEQTLWSMLAAMHQPAYYFNSNQVVMASPQMHLNKNLIAIHFSRPYRSAIKKINKKIDSIGLDNQHQYIELDEIGKFSFIEFYFSKYYNKAKRKLKRTPNMKHK